MNFDMRAFAADLCRFASTAGEEAAAADFVENRLAELGFETYAWDADPELLADHPSFPDDIDESDVAGRRSVAGVLALGGSNNGNPRDDAPTIVVNGHIDVVPAEPAEWSSDPFEPVWGESGNKREGNDTVETLTARGAADMKFGQGVAQMIQMLGTEYPCDLAADALGGYSFQALRCSSTCGSGSGAETKSEGGAVAQPFEDAQGIIV
jgi:acetylornithine deacetylase/succinyl-diaminopimelate desuccinylase-like protein